jgi:hypothetical protein
LRLNIELLKEIVSRVRERPMATEIIQEPVAVVEKLEANQVSVAERLGMETELTAEPCLPALAAAEPEPQAVKVSAVLGQTAPEMSESEAEVLRKLERAREMEKEIEMELSM